MQRKVLISILVCLSISFVLCIGACKRAGMIETATVTQTALPTQGLEQRTQTGTSIQPSGQPTETAGEPPSEQPYPLPTNPINPGPYPQPSGEVSTLAPGTSTTLAYPAPVSTSTLPATSLPQYNLTQISPSATVTLRFTQTPPVSPSATSSATYVTDTAEPTAIPTATSAETQAYPGPQSTATSAAYPGPGNTSTSPAYPGPATVTPNASSTPSGSATASATPSTAIPTGASPSGTFSPTPIPRQGTGTPFTTPTEQPPRPPLTPPPAGGAVTIWHSWGIAETDVLQSIIQSFQRLYPDVTFNLRYIPQDDLFNTYYEAAYLGQGPSLLLGPSSWGPQLFDEDLVANLDPYIPENYLTSISPPALSSGKYKNSLISLPLSQHGLLMFRNSSIIAEAPGSMEELNSLAHQTTHGGVVGSYLERGATISSADIIGLGGRIMDEDGYPAFNDQYGLEWLDLLAAYDEAGAVTFNTNRDQDMFKRGRVGLIIDGSWNIPILSQAIGTDNLAIDPWLSYGTGHLAGWVEADSIYLNANSIEKDRFASLSFMGYLLDPNVQIRLAEVGHIPVVITTQPRDRLMQQAMQAFIDGVPYPIAIESSILNIYWSELDKAIKDVFEHGVDPADALQTAAENISQDLDKINAIP
jgi:maltose-binding protein MalE